MGLSEEVLAVERLLRNEIELVDAQIRRSRLARGAPSFEYTPEPLPPPVHPARAASLDREPIAPTAAADGDTAVGAAPASPALGASATAGSPPASASLSRASSSSALADPTLNPAERDMLRQNVKCGAMQYFKKSFFGGGFEFCYLVADNAVGLRWYKSEREFAQQPQKPLGTLPYFSVTTNSRGSRFKEPAVVWPLITREECAKASDAGKCYFGVQFTSGDKLEFFVLAASSARERDEWVFFLTKYIKLYIPQGEEFLEFASMRVGAEQPLHVRQVLDGEAPGSPKRTQD